jgi:hypothetical protein
MLLIFQEKEVNGELNRVRKHLKHKKKRVDTLSYNNIFLLKGFIRFLTSDLCKLLLEARHLDDL